MNLSYGSVGEGWPGELLGLDPEKVLNHSRNYHANLLLDFLVCFAYLQKLFNVKSPDLRYLRINAWLYSLAKPFVELNHLHPIAVAYAPRLCSNVSQAGDLSQASPNKELEQTTGHQQLIRFP